ncbi:hypothetical protein RFI_28578 [Reticulomyxa filosa]|uniref:Acyl-CoA dehydrogenase/oxidase N-terminal domain-containing protein n=1 Tax=Reticulomyxa filosa TaxID=46433 RepID=X6M4F2_RETFI|nr:hypothetical protein RFI_28578 [Reticulomyxa filosa]|eukprot:ETO08809.1 hypothetical protein RFI_28578 [Reticulomyxa filosa]
MSGKKEKKEKIPDPKGPLIACDWENQPSPYYTERHKRFRKYVRAFVEKEVAPYLDKWEAQQDIPKEFYKKAYDYGLYASVEEEEKLILSRKKEHRMDAFSTVCLCDFIYMCITKAKKKNKPFLQKKKKKKKR